MPCFSTIQWFSSETNGFRIGGGDVGVVERAERVADVVEQRADDVLLVPPPRWASVAVCSECSSRSTAKPP